MPRNQEMDVGLPPGMPAARGGGDTSKPPTRRSRTPSPRRARSSTSPSARSAAEPEPEPEPTPDVPSPVSPGPSAGSLADFPTENPYARDARVPMNHRVYSSIPGRLGQLSEELGEAGYGARQVSQAELVQAILHFHTPQTLEDARVLLQRWALLKAAPPAD